MDEIYRFKFRCSPTDPPAHPHTHTLSHTQVEEEQVAQLRKAVAKRIVGAEMVLR